MKKNSNSFSNLRIFNITIVIVLICIVVWIVKKRQQLSPIVLNDYTVEFYDNDDKKIADDNNKYYCVVELLPNVMKENEKKSKAYTWHFLAHSTKAFKEVKFKFKDTKWQQQFSFEDKSLGFGGNHTYSYNKDTTTMTITGAGNSVDLYINDVDGCDPNSGSICHL